MKAKTFTGITLEEVRKKIWRWRTGHKGASIKKEHDPVVRDKRAHMAVKIGTGEVLSVSIRIEYLDSN